ncbi:MAG: hypothetical protein AABY22_14470 [Nanoarchaeota archaeon]
MKINDKIIFIHEGQEISGYILAMSCNAIAFYNEEETVLSDSKRFFITYLNIETQNIDTVKLSRVQLLDLLRG